MLLKKGLELADLVNSKLENIICYFAAKTKYLTEKRLHKLVYTAELYYIEEFCKRLTNIPFKNYNYGVWSPDVANANTWLDGIKLNIKEEKTEKGHIASFIEPIGDFSFELREEEISILDKVLEDWGFEATDELVAFTKSTLPWEKSSFGEDVDLGAYVEECKREDEFFSRKEVIEELDRIDKEGKFVPLR